MTAASTTLGAVLVVTHALHGTNARSGDVIYFGPMLLPPCDLSLTRHPRQEEMDSGLHAV